MAAPENQPRRIFLKQVCCASAGFGLGINLNACSSDQRDNTVFSPGIWLSISPDNQVRVTVSKSEMGQGILTALAMLVAEELDADWRSIQVVQADLDPVYGSMITAGS